MEYTEFNKKQVILYLIFTFGIAWVIHGVIAYLAAKGYTIAYQILLALSMFAPMLGVLLSRHSLKGMGWKPRFKGNIGVILTAWFLPPVLVAVGAVLYFLAFPAHFDLSGKYLVAAVGEEGVRQIEAQGMTYPVLVLVGTVACLTYAPAMNLFFAVGEEAGWRGFLYPQMKARFGRRLGRVLGGVIWGLWHAPLIWLIGYEYGTDYFGYPAVGILAFCVITVALGTLHDWVYEKSGCIWVPAILHGSFNAAATIPPMVCVPDTGWERLLGPAPVGLLAALPMFVIAAVLLFKKQIRSNI